MRNMHLERRVQQAIMTPCQGDFHLGGLRVLVAGRRSSTMRLGRILHLDVTACSGSRYPLFAGGLLRSSPSSLHCLKQSALKTQLMNSGRTTTLYGSLVVPIADAANDPDIVRDCQVVDALLRKLIGDSPELTVDAAYELIKARMKRVCLFHWDKMTMWKP